MRTGMSAAGMDVEPTPDTSMLDLRNLRKLKRQDSGGTPMGSLQPHPMRPFLWACRLPYATLFEKLKRVFMPVLLKQRGDALMKARIEQPFCGLDRNGEKDHRMRLVIRGQYYGVRHEYEADDSHPAEAYWYKLTYQAFDQYGQILAASDTQYIALSSNWEALQRQLMSTVGAYLRGIHAIVSLPEHEQFRERGEQSRM